MRSMTAASGRLPTRAGHLRPPRDQAETNAAPVIHSNPVKPFAIDSTSNKK